MTGVQTCALPISYIFCFRDSVFAIPDNTLSKKLFTFFLASKQPIACSNSPFSYSKWPNIQLIVITFGQLLHIAGLALAGGYGILRKNPDGEIALAAKFYMGMLGGGGLIAIIGGLMFVYICVKRLYVLQIYNKY